jgi:hypothetical protein
VGITFSHLAFSYWIDYLGFITEGKTCCYIHKTLLLGFSNWPVIYYTQSSFLASSSPRHHGLMFWVQRVITRNFLSPYSFYA